MTLDPKNRTVGQPIDRVDAIAKVTGAASYAAEIPVANVAYAVLVTARPARGTLQPLDVAPARAIAGVLDVLTAQNAPKLAAPALEPATPDEPRLHLLQTSAIAHAGQPIAVVIAETIEGARHAASLLVPHYDDDAKRPPELDLTAAFQQLDPSTAPVHVVQTYATPAQHHHAIEPHATTAMWQGDAALTVYDTSEAVFAAQGVIARVLGLRPENVRVIGRVVGGGFGGKRTPWSHTVLAALAAKLVHRPVKLEVARTQLAGVVGHRPQTVQRVALGATGAGKLVAIAHDVLAASSRNDAYVAPTTEVSAVTYACTNIRRSDHTVALDIAAPTSMRAAGLAPGSFALESALDELAWQLAIDPIDLRVRNFATVDPRDNKPWSSNSLRACFQRGAAEFGWGKRVARPRAMKHGSRLVGFGMATASASAPQEECTASARMRADGTATVAIGSPDAGGGTLTILQQVAADALELPISAVRIELGDSAFPHAPAGGTSATAASASSAVELACRTLLAKLTQLAIADPKSPIHAQALAELDVGDGSVISTTDPSKRDAYSSIVARTKKPEIVSQVIVQGSEDRDSHSCRAFGAQFCEVEVDEPLGAVRVTRFVGAFAAGAVLNPKLATTQLHSGITMAIGLALTERGVLDRAGRPITRNLFDYAIPTIADVPDITIALVDEPDPIVSKLGAKGIADLAMTGAVAAIANAVYHATGVRVRELPITADKLIKA